jgi:carbon-monoxide dehydrogenase small subunit
MIMAAHYLLENNPNPTDEEIKEGLAGNLCRCTGYIPIIAAVKEHVKSGEKDKGARRKP